MNNQSAGMTPFAVTAEHHSAILALNQAAVPHVNSISATDLAAIADQSCYFRAIPGAATADGNIDIAGFMLALAEGTNYQSLNYRWFADHYERFVYVDRIVIAAEHAGRGLGRLLYRDLEQAAGNAPMITCEVNLQPPNPASLKFHQTLGFREVGQQEWDGGSKRVRLLRKDIG